MTTAGVSGNAKHSNTPASYWIVPNSYQLDQLVFKVERELDTVQTDHIDWGFRSVQYVWHRLPLHDGRRLV